MPESALSHIKSQHFLSSVTNFDGPDVDVLGSLPTGENFILGAERLNDVDTMVNDTARSAFVKMDSKCRNSNKNSTLFP